MTVSTLVRREASQPGVTHYFIAASRFGACLRTMVVTPSSRKINMHQPPSADILDALHFRANQRKLKRLLSQEDIELWGPREDFESLQTQERLPSAYRQVYAQWADKLLQMSKSIRQFAMQVDSVRHDVPPFSEMVQAAYRANYERPVSPDVLSAIRRTIEEINAVETRLIDSCEAAFAMLHEQEKSDLIDWRIPLEYRFTMQIDPGPERDFYDTCGSGELPLEILIDGYTPEGRLEDGIPYNWNIFTHREGHPLSADFHGYIVHCITDHGVLPWQLIHHIKEIDVELVFNTSEPVWRRPPAPMATPWKRHNE